MTRRGYLARLFLLKPREALILGTLLLLAALVLAVNIGLLYGHNRPQAPDARQKPDAISQIEPGFDVIRVTRDGRAVMAGRAPPDARVIVKSGDQVIGEVRADKRGDWVMIPETPLKPGAQVLTLRTQRADEGPVLSRDSAVISVPLRPDGDVFVAVSREGKATRVLDQGLPEIAPQGVAVAAIDLAPEGGAILSGHAEPGQRVRIYMDNQAAGETLADGQGHWELTFSGALAPGAHTLRADQLDASGKVILRAETGFSRAAQGPFVKEGQQVTVMKGNALWEIARKIYGSGVAYSIIFAGNKQQIRDPDMIYPGQVLDIPNAVSGNERLSPAAATQNKIP